MTNSTDTFIDQDENSNKADPFLNDKAEVGLRIKTLRDGKKMTQAELARLVDKSRPAIAQWEKGEASPSLTDLNKLAFFLNTSPQYLAFGITSSAQDSYRVPVMDYSTPAGHHVGEMALDLEFYRGLHLPASANLRAFRLPRGDMIPDCPKGTVVIIDESDKLLVGTGEAVLIHHKVPAVAFVNIVPGKENTYMVNIGGQRLQVDGGLPVIGKVVAILKSTI